MSDATAFTAHDARDEEPIALVYTASGLTTGAPHVRDTLDLRHVFQGVAVALVPCGAMALYNTGYQANVALASLGADGASGWRHAVLSSLSVGSSPTSPLSCVLHGLLWVAPVLAVAFATARAWELAFALARGRTPIHSAFVTALLFTFFLPPGIPLWLVALGASFGVVIGKEVFGGTGYNFVNPVVAGLAFLTFAYPSWISGDAVWTPADGVALLTPLGEAAGGGLAALQAMDLGWTSAFVGRVPGPLGGTSALAAVIGAALLLFTRIASWRIVAGGIVGVAGGALLAGLLADAANPMAGVPWHWHLALGTLALGLLFLATDPVTAPMTDKGRWIHGALVGALVVLIRVANPAHRDGVILAILLGNIFAPLIDSVVIHLHVRRRARRHG